MKKNISIKIGKNIFTIFRNGKMKKQNSKSNVYSTTSTVRNDPIKETKTYSPNDPFQSQVNEVNATTSISKTHKPWVKKAWFLLNVIFPFALTFIIFIGYFMSPILSKLPLSSLIFLIILFSGYGFIFYHIWFNNVKNK